MADRTTLVSNPNLTPSEEAHITVMRAIAQAVADTPMVLKGGTALLLIYGLDRFSEDLDFDSSKAINLENRIQQAASKHVKVKSIDVLKDTNTVSRYRLVYESSHGEGRLKVETSLRTQPMNFQLINGIKVYDLSSLIDQKLNALENRTTARDLYDINFLAITYPEKFSDKQWEKINNLCTDLNALEQRFMPAFEDDLILAKHDISKLILSLHEAKLNRHLRDKPE